MDGVLLGPQAVGLKVEEIQAEFLREAPDSFFIYFDL